MTTEQPTQLQLLHHDIRLTREMVSDRSSTIVGLGDLENAGRHNLLLVVAELFFRVVDLADGLGAVLTARRYSSSQVIQRALLEAGTTLDWLIRQPTPEETAWLYTAYSTMKLQSALGEDVSPRNAGQALDDVPDDLRNRAESYLRHKNNWCGKPIRQMMEECGLPYAIYAWCSEETHGRVMGVQAGLHVDGPEEAIVRFGLFLDEERIELIANAGRVTLLRAFGAFSKVALGGLLSVQTISPAAWNPEWPRGEQSAN